MRTLLIPRPDKQAVGAPVQASFENIPVASSYFGSHNFAVLYLDNEFDDETVSFQIGKRGQHVNAQIPLYDAILRGSTFVSLSDSVAEWAAST